MYEGFVLKLLDEYKINYTLWKRKTEARIRCLFPNHDDSTASLSINLITGRFGCFGCNQGGNIEKFNELITGKYVNLQHLISPEDAFKMDVMLRMYQPLVMEHDEVESYRDFKLLYDEISKRFVPAIMSEVAYTYLKGPRRKLSDSAIRKFKLMFAKSGKYEGRVIIPYFKNEQIIGFNSRLIVADKKHDSDLRYRYMICTEKFTGYLYNFNNVDKKLNQCILVEGPFDLIYMDTLGFKNVISTLSTLVKREHTIGFSHFNKLLFYFDSDRNNAGFNAILKASELIHNIYDGKEIRYAKLPEGKDPNECSKEELLSAKLIKISKSQTEKGFEGLEKFL